MKQAQKLDFVDGLKVLACLTIFNFHFINFYYCGIYSLLPQDYHVQAVEAFIGTSPLNILMGGKFGVKMFMTISGFFVGYRFFLTGDKSSLSAGVVKKYFRLVFPIITANIAIYAMMKLGLFMNDEASAIIGSQVHVGNYNQFAPSLFAAVKEAVWGCFATGANKYNGPLWFIYYEFFGTILVAAIISLLGKSKARYIVYVIAGILTIRSDFLPFIMGAVVCDLTYCPPKWILRLSEQKWLMWILLLFGLALGSYPPIGETARLGGSIYAMIPPKVMIYYVIGAACVLYAVLHLKAPQKVLGSRILTWLNTYSYGFYLVHFMLLCTFSCGLYLALHEHVNYHLLAVINYVLTFGLTVFISFLIHKFVEIPGMKLANGIAKKLCND